MIQIGGEGGSAERLQKTTGCEGGGDHKRLQTTSTPGGMGQKTKRLLGLLVFSPSGDLPQSRVVGCVGCHSCPLGDFLVTLL